jgi:hypothetical protein
VSASEHHLGEQPHDFVVRLPILGVAATRTFQPSPYGPTTADRFAFGETRGLIRVAAGTRL